MQHITDRHFDAERALYNLRDATVSRCRFGGLITADSVGEIVRGNAVMGCRGEVRLRGGAAETRA